MKAAPFSQFITVTITIILLALSPRPDAQAEAKLGLVTSRPCPYSCETRVLPKNICRDWHEGDTCYVEDLSKPAESNSTTDENLGLDLPIKTRHPLQADEVVPPGRVPDGEDCKGLYRNEIAPPRINLDLSSADGKFFERTNAQGSVEGICVQEAGYFERGAKVSEISVQTTRQFKRFNFNIRFRRDREPEIRVYNSAGDSDVISLTDSRRNSAGQR